VAGPASSGVRPFECRWIKPEPASRDDTSLLRSIIVKDVILKAPLLPCQSSRSPPGILVYAGQRSSDAQDDVFRVIDLRNWFRKASP